MDRKAKSHGISRKPFTKGTIPRSLAVAAFVILIAGATTAMSQVTELNLLEMPFNDVTITLTEGTNMAAVPSPDGQTIILALQGALWSMPSSGGKATKLTGWDVEATWPSWSPDGSRIAFQNYFDNNYHIFTMAPDGSGLTQWTTGPYDDREPGWSPDGKKLAFSSDRSGNGSYDIWSIDLATGTYKQWTSLTTNEHSPSWSPDGLYMAYADGRFVYKVDSVGNRTLVASAPSGSVLAPAWSPDGLDVVYQNNNRQIVVGGNPVTPGEDVYPFPVRWFPDGRFLYAADGKLRVRNPTGSNPDDIAFSAALTVRRPVQHEKDHGFKDKTPRSVRGISAPVLSPDGKQIAFIALNDLWVMEIDKKKPVRLTNDTFIDWDPSWSSDGEYIYFASDRHGSGKPDIYSFELATSKLTRVSDISDAVIYPVPSPDGGSIAYINSSQQLKIYEVASGQTRLVVNAASPWVGKPTWSPDGKTIALADLRRINTRFREGYNLIRTVDVATGVPTFREPAPPPNHLSERFEAGPAWSPDGQWMAFIMNSTLHVLPVDPSTGAPTGPAVQLTDHAADLPSWSGDSRTILYLANGILRTIQVDGTGQRDIPLDLTYKQAMPDGLTVVHAGKMWDGINPVLHEDVDIMIVDNRIMQIRPHNPHAKPKADHFIDASALTVMPGLWDPHIHPRVKDYTGGWWAIQLAYGITSVTSNGCSTYISLMAREALESGSMVGPRLFTGAMFDGSRSYYGHHRSITYEQILVDIELPKAIDMDYDFFKTYVRAPASYFARVAQGAHLTGVPAGSHFLTPGIQTGETQTTHLAATSRVGFDWTQSPAGISYPDVIDLYSKGDFRLCSTHGGNALIGYEPTLVQDPRFLLLMPPNFQTGLINNAQRPPTPAQLDSIRRSVVTPAAILHSGGLVALGTDSPVSAPALGQHMTIRAFTYGPGVTNHEVLQSVTINAAKLSNAAHELGTVEPGKIADLVMIRGNPLESVDNLTNVEMVMKNGVIYTIADILRPYEVQ